MRPFHFAVLFWGEHYRRHYFVDKFLRSMLGHGNLPLLDAKDGHKLVIACPLEDRRIVSQDPIFHRLYDHVIPTWIEIDYPEPGPDDSIRTNAILHQHKWFATLLRETHDPNAYGSVWSPDCIVSTDLVRRMFEWIAKGYDCVICPVLRQAEEPLLLELGGRRSLAQQEAISLSIRHLHREMWPFIEPIAKQLTHAPYRLWRMPNGGMLIHGFFGLPVFMDYRVVSSDYRDGNIDTCLRTGNFAACRNIHIINDCDELVVISLTPKDFKNFAEFPDEKLTKRDTLLNIRTAYRFFASDKPRAQMFRTPIRWHIGAIDDEWRKREAEIEREVKSAIAGNIAAYYRFDYDWSRLGRIPGRIKGEIYQRAAAIAGKVADK